MLLLFVLILLLMASAFFSCAETALISLPEYKLKKLLIRKHKTAEILYKLKSKPKELIITILIGNNIVNISAAAIGTKIALDYFGDAGIGVATGVMTFLILTFGEITPKAYATVYAEKLALIIARPLSFVKILLYPIVFIFRKITDFMFFIFKNKHHSEGLTEEEIISILRLGSEQRVIAKDERELMENILELDDTNVSQVTTKEDLIFMLDEEKTIKEVVDEINKKHYSRIPVYKSPERAISGFIHIKDILRNVNNPELKLKEIKKDLFLVKYNEKVGDVFEKMQEKSMHIAGVLNKEQNFIGIVTMEDLFEEIFGEIYDEKDINPNKPIKINKNIYLLHYNTKISKINDIFNSKISSEKDKSILEILIETKKQLDKGTVINLENIKFRIECTVKGKPRIIKAINLNKKLL